MDTLQKQALTKVPQVTLIFWLVKILATTLGETAGDALSMSLNLGYLVSSVIFIGLFAIAVAIQIRSKQYSSSIYWATIIATTTAGTTMADFADRSLGIGYTGGTLLLVSLLCMSFSIWYVSAGSLSNQSINNTKTECFYWVTILLSQTLGTALGDWTVDSAGLGYDVSALIFGSLLLVLLAAYLWSSISRTLLFWLSFILTRPLGAVVGDFLDKPISHGGLEFSRFSASAALLFGMVLCLMLFKQQAATTHH
ncbi:hypothetical protein H5125_17875 [Shewanella sp. SR44-4]|jgi:uncharacterized membrane-anchored protein|uniref:COG4705 family protein n=1 Tax=unclassified Shewanella TaxID=196818 RepID=UPI001600DB70|nr:hypothetical protein [Shewanella sp. SR44-4]MBB1364012.1 hypothetical protein [Shewanella sp. SR44-4]